MIHSCLPVDRVLVAKDEHMAAFGLDPADILRNMEKPCPKYHRVRR
jgi:hypothetical protein